MNRIKQLISFRTKYSVKLFLAQFKSVNYFKNQSIDVSKNQAYIFLAADYGNLGDVAITYAQTKFLEENSNFQVIEIPISKSLEGLWFVKKHIKKGDVVTTVGGGNLGDLYDQIEFIRQLVVRFFPNNKIISFPQTFDFSETAQGKKALQIAQKVYNNHANFNIIAREKTSFGLMKQHFSKANVVLTPDIVLSLNKVEPKLERKGVVICMRKDAEKSLTQEQNDFIIKSAHSHYGDVSYYDTHIGRSNLSIAERNDELNKIWSKFKNAELVITDRLHGMIFCYITNTPCLVFQNNNHKVRETYDWIKKADYITLMTSFSEDKIDNYFDEQSSKNISDYISLHIEYQPLKELLH
jgi:pyruvyl transferase EpsI